MSNNVIRIRYVKSANGYAPDQRQTVKSLGLNRLNEVAERPDTPDIRGMVNKVRHLVEIEGEGQLDASEIHDAGDEE